MSKALVGDKVSVMKVHPDTNTKFIAVTGVLSALDRGRKTEDKRAHAEDGDCPAEVEVDAKGWCVLTTDDGKRVSAPTKEVVLHTQKVLNENAATMAALETVLAERAVQTSKVDTARTFCAAHGLDVETLTADNMLKLAVLLPALPA